MQHNIIKIGIKYFFLWIRIHGHNQINQEKNNWIYLAHYQEGTYSLSKEIQPKWSIDFNSYWFLWIPSFLLTSMSSQKATGKYHYLQLIFAHNILNANFRCIEEHLSMARSDISNKCYEEFVKLVYWHF